MIETPCYGQKNDCPKLFTDDAFTERDNVGQHLFLESTTIGRFSASV